MRLHKLFFRLLAITACALAVCSCTEDNTDFTTSTGTLEATVCVDSSISSPAANTIVELGFEAPAPESLTVSLTDASGQYSASWASIAEMPDPLSLQTGTYTLSALSPDITEGFDSPIYYGSHELTVTDGAVLNETVTAKVASTIISASYSIDNASVVSVALTLHSSNAGEFIEYPMSETRPLFLYPGDITILATVKMADGRSVTLNPGTLSNAAAATHYIINVRVDSDVPTLHLSFNPEVRESIDITLDDALLNGTPPVVTPVGFTPGTPMVMVEGGDPSTEIGFEVQGSDILSIVLSAASPSLLSQGLDTEVDVMTPEGLAMAEEFGTVITGNRINISGTLSRIAYSYGQAESSFTIVARDAAGRVNEPVTLQLVTTDAELTVLSCDPAMTGINYATATIRTDATDLDANLRIDVVDNNGRWSQTTITRILRQDDNTWRVTFALPDGTTSVLARVYYCGRLKATLTVTRYAPQFGISVDAFASAARIRIDMADEKSSLRGLITAKADIYSGTTRVTVMSRDTVNGYIDVVGLTPSSTYKLRATMFRNPTSDADYTEAVRITTESAAQLKNPDFEEIKDCIEYKDLLSGGRYSQTIVDIYNQQNRTSYDVDVPKDWAHINSKTFCTKARRHNTWYMQPSVMTSKDAQQGGFSIELVNVAWDIDGPAIPDYTQQGTPYLRYNPNIPEIAHRAAGRAWLGSYSFDAATGEETIKEGISFGSRPTSLNGYYKYLPGPVANTERGMVQVKVWGEVDGVETLIAESHVQLGINPDFSSFSVPLTYDLFGVKATKICVILSASEHIGTIAYETANVQTTPVASTATSTGNRLLVDNLSFAY